MSFGFIHHFDGTDLYVDPAEYFTGRDAVRAAREDGKLTPGEDLPDPFYVRNKDTALPQVPVSGNFIATVLDSQLAKRSLTALKFAELYCGNSHDGWLYADPSSLPMHLRVSGGLVVKADEQYLP